MKQRKNSESTSIPEVFSVKEVAALFRVSTQMVKYLIRVGELRAIRLGTRFRIPRDEVEKALGKSLEHDDLEQLGIKNKRRKRGGSCRERLLLF